MEKLKRMKQKIRLSHKKDMRRSESAHQLEDHHCYMNLATTKQIDKKFKEYQQQFNQDYQEGLQMIKMQRVNVDSKMDIKRTVSGIRNSVLNIQTNESMETERNVMSMMAMEKELQKIQNDVIIKQLYQLSNPNLINSRMQEHTQQKLIQVVCNEFGINYSQIIAINSQQQRVQMIVQQIDTSFKDEMAQFKRKLDKKQGEYVSQEQQHLQNYKQSMKNKKDVFKWLKVDNKFQPLKQKFKMELVNCIEQEDITEHSSYISHRRTLSQNTHNNNYNSTYNNNPSNQKNIEVINNNNNNQSQSTNINTNTKFRSSKRPFNFSNIDFDLNTQSQMNLKIIQQQLAIQQQEQQIQREYKTRQRKMQEGFAQLNNDDTIQYQWNQEYENHFKQLRNKYKHDMINLINSSSWNQIAFSNFVQNIQLQIKNQQRRDLLLDKYQFGIGLNAKELQFIASTSRLLNFCIDRKYIQSEIDSLDKDLLQDVELNLAKKVVEDYERIKNKIYETRQKWLQNERQEKNKQKRQKNEPEQFYKKIKQHYKQFMQKLKYSRKGDETEHVNYYNIQSSPYIKMMDHVLKKVKLKITQNNKEKNRKHLSKSQTRLYSAKPTPENQKYLYPEQKITVLDSRRNFHPASKLITQKLKTYEENGKKVTMKDKEQVIKKQREVERYRVTKQEDVISKRRFHNFYSGGPVKPFCSVLIDNAYDHYEYPESCKINQPWLNMKIAVQAAIKIQAFFRKQIHKLRYKRQMNEPKATYLQFHDSNGLKLTNMLSRKILIDEDPSQVSTQHQIKKKANYGVFENLNQYAINKKASMNLQKAHSQRKNKNYLKQQYNQEVSQVKVSQLFLAVKKGNLNMLSSSNTFYSIKDINAVDQFKNTPLYYACKNNDEKMVEFLLQRGAKPNIKCQEGDTPTHMAFKSNNHLLIVNVLQNGADLNIMNNQQNTPLAYASTALIDRLGLLNGVVSGGQNYDNNKLLNPSLPLQSQEQDFLIFPDRHLVQ